MDEFFQHYFGDVVIILALIMFNGLLAMAELSLVSSNRAKVDSLAKRSKGAQIALELMDHPGIFLSTIQIGITIIGLVAGAFSGQKFAEPMGVWLNTFSWIAGYGASIAFTLVVMVVTFISIVMGELIPKRIAISQPEQVAIFFARPIRLLSKITYPFVVLLDVSSKAILKLFNHHGVKASNVTEEEIHYVMKMGLEEGAIDAFEHKVFQKILQFGDREASVIMTPRIKVIYLDIEDSLEENYKKILKYPHRYYPVFDGGLDNFKGIIDIKDAFAEQIKGKKLDLKSLIKKAPCVLEENLGQDLLEKFKQYKTHIAVVVDEYGSMQGIITLLDIFETLIGSNPTSQQDKHYEITKRKDGSWLCDGLTPIDEIEELLGVQIIDAFEENDFNTLGGFLLMHFKCIPKAGEYINWDAFKFEIMDMDDSRIDKVLIQKKKVRGVRYTK